MNASPWSSYAVAPVTAELAGWMHAAQLALADVQLLQPCDVEEAESHAVAHAVTCAIEQADWCVTEA